MFEKYQKIWGLLGAALLFGLVIYLSYQLEPIALKASYFGLTLGLLGVFFFFKPQEIKFLDSGEKVFIVCFWGIIPYMAIIAATFKEYKTITDWTEYHYSDESQLSYYLIEQYYHLNSIELLLFPYLRGLVIISMLTFAMGLSKCQETYFPTKD